MKMKWKAAWWFVRKNHAKCVLPPLTLHRIKSLEVRTTFWSENFPGRGWYWDANEGFCQLIPQWIVNMDEEVIHCFSRRTTANVKLMAELDVSGRLVLVRMRKHFIIHLNSSPFHHQIFQIWVSRLIYFLRNKLPITNSNREQGASLPNFRRIETSLTFCKSLLYPIPNHFLARFDPMTKS